MLVISRKRRERVFIGDDIVISIAEIRDGSVRLAIEAPRDVPIRREELQKLEPPRDMDAAA